MPFVLCMMGFVVLFLAGCGKEEKSSESTGKLTSATNVPSHSPASYMNDPEFRKQLSDKRKELQAIVAERKPLADRMEALVKEHGENLAALQKIPEWNELHKKVVALNAKYEEVRKRQLEVVRKRIAPSARSGKDSASPLRSGKDSASPLTKEISK